MNSSITCPVCGMAFIYRGAAASGQILICPICGAKLEVESAAPDPQVRKLPQEPLAEITDRIDNFARMRGYIFNEDKELFIKGLMAKKERYGDFFCPCRFHNVQENLCPCLESRAGQVRNEGHCLCGLFNLPAGETVTKASDNPG